MTTVHFSALQPGILSELLLSSYAQNQALVAYHKNDWKAFDTFVYDNLDFMDSAGFITMHENQPIGFMSWDSRRLPESVEIGHNCIIRKYQGQGFGKEQLQRGIKVICGQNPETLIVKTGAIEFFLPAQKMYESVGFTKKEVIRHTDPVVSEVIVYRLEL